MVMLIGLQAMLCQIRPVALSSVRPLFRFTAKLLRQRISLNCCLSQNSSTNNMHQSENQNGVDSTPLSVCSMADSAPINWSSMNGMSEPESMQVEMIRVTHSPDLELTEILAKVFNQNKAKIEMALRQWCSATRLRVEWKCKH